MSKKEIISEIEALLDSGFDLVYLSGGSGECGDGFCVSRRASNIAYSMGCSPNPVRRSTSLSEVKRMSAYQVKKYIVCGKPAYTILLD